MVLAAGACEVGEERRGLACGDAGGHDEWNDALVATGAAVSCAGVGRVVEALTASRSKGPGTPLPLQDRPRGVPGAQRSRWAQHGARTRPWAGTR
jgi:hypothetical protein